MRLLFLSKLLPRADVIGGPILIYHRIKNLHRMGHNITLIAPAYEDEDRSDKSLTPFCESIILVECVKERPPDEIEELHKRLNRPRFFLTGDGGFCEGIEDSLRSILKEEHFNAIIAEYSMMGQYLEENDPLAPTDTLKIISVHECYTNAFVLRVKKGEVISKATIQELADYEFKMYNTADRILSLTREDADILVNYAPNLKNKINTVPSGVDTEFFIPPKKRRRDTATNNILYLGNFQHYPNVDAVKNFMNHCWRKILLEVPSARFHAIGFHPPQELIDLRSGNVVIEEGGDDKNVRRTYWNSDVFVAPIELGTGFRGKILEAMACGLPVVATSLATFGIDPIHGKDMFVSDDYGVFSKYVISLLEDRKLREKTAANAILLAKKFDHRYAAEKLERVIKMGKRLV